MCIYKISKRCVNKQKLREPEGLEEKKELDEENI
jgi:hypothetical protein